MKAGAASAATRAEAPARPLAFDLSNRTKLRVTGADRIRFLNGQLTNDVRQATARSAIHAAILNAKGRINADVFVHAREETLIIDAEASVRAALVQRLERYIIADDVQLEDVTDELSLFHLIGDAPETSARGSVVASDRYGHAGCDIWVVAEERQALRDQLCTHCVLPDEAEMETFRIERGIPRWGYELSEEIIPLEANLEAGAIDYAKGCYIGQEVISRMKMSGQTNKRLCGLVSLAGAPLQSGMRLFAEGEPQRDAGWITSATRSATLGKEIALGFVKRGYNGNGTALLAGASEAIPVEVAPLPFI